LAAILCNEGLILMIFGIVGMIDGLRLNRASAEAGDAFGPGWYLITLSVVLIVCGLCYLVSTLKGRDKKTDAAEESFSWTGPASFAIIAMIISCALLPYIGYFLSTAAFLLVCTRVFGEQSWVKSILIASLSGAIFWGVFVYMAQIPMP
jgi:hypothetical protein